MFDGFENREELDYYYPTSVLVTGWDIIFLWVARMIMAGYEWEGKKPFSDVYFTGMVRDKQRRKMSKSLGNSPDALALIDEYGADAVRYGMLSCSPAGGDLLFDIKLVENGRNFCNKIWNATRLIKSWKTDASIETPDENLLAMKWIDNKLQSCLEALSGNYLQYRISDCLMNLYSFIWNDIFSWYLEIIKPEYGQAIDLESRNHAIGIFRQFCILLHPFMPFITEEVYQSINEEGEGAGFCANAEYPKANSNYDKKLLNDFVLAQDIISNVRDTRNKNQLKPKEECDLYYVANDEINSALSQQGYASLIKKMSFVKQLKATDKSDEQEGFVFISGKTKFFALFDIEVDAEEELKKATEELGYQQGFVASVSKKLSNERFVNNAPETVVEKERKKLADGQARIEALQSRIDQLKKMLD